jgi:predicted hotdog family 3-hydroxylacyl-ACP dehydratase
MFGYVKPVVADLLVREHEFYKATYCGICRSMKKHTGTLSNVTLSYDSVFLALVRMAYIPDLECRTELRRCIAHPAKRRPMLEENEATEYTARAFAILTHYKLLDDILDEKLVKRAAVSLARPITSHAVSLADLSDLEAIVADRLARITELEEAKCPSIDEPAELFGQLLGEIFSYGYDGEARLVSYECGLHLGKFIYAADAAEDYERDRVSGAYNPYVLMYGGEELSDENRASIKCGLILECRELEGAVNLLPFGTLATIENIIKNIIYLGLTKRIEFLDKSTREKESENEQ